MVKGCLIALLVFLSPFVLLAAALYWLFHGLSGNGCTVTTITEQSSIDGIWSASIQEWLCESPFVTDIAAEVHLSSTRDSRQGVDVLAVDTNGHDADRPRIAWTASDVLQVTVPNISFVKILRRQYQDVRIDVRFNPDDPVARVEWLKKLDRLSEPGDRR